MSGRTTVGKRSSSSDWLLGVVPLSLVAFDLVIIRSRCTSRVLSLEVLA